MEPITFEKAMTATKFEHTTLKNADKKTPVRCKRTGKTQTWKTRPGEFKIPVKYGLRESFYITNQNAAEWGIPS